MVLSCCSCVGQEDRASLSHAVSGRWPAIFMLNDAQAHEKLDKSRRASIVSGNLRLVRESRCIFARQFPERDLAPAA